jgi:hypothetical protein
MNTMEFVFGDDWTILDPCGKCGRDWFKSGWLCPSRYEDICREIEHMCRRRQEEMWLAMVYSILGLTPDDVASLDGDEVSSDNSTA